MKKLTYKVNRFVYLYGNDGKGYPNF